MSGFSIISDTACPVDEVMKVMHAAFDPRFGEAWTKAQLLGSLVQRECHCYLGVDNLGDTRGFALVRRLFEEEELLLLAVEPEMRRQGVGSALLNRWIDDAAERGTSRLFLEMRRGNPAESLYRGIGFEQVGLRPEYYPQVNGKREDAITFAFLL